MLEIVHDIGTSQMEYEIQKARNIVMKKAQECEIEMQRQTGVSPSIQEAEIRKYLEEIINEIKTK